jgi:hypothetical protein
MTRRTQRKRTYAPRPSGPEPRRALLTAVRAFVRAAANCPGVYRIALLGSLTTDKPVPRDADVLVTIEGATDLAALARAGRRLQGQAGSINLGADVFLADQDGRYLGRICGFRECHPRMRCRARNCGGREHLNDDLDVVTLPQKLLAAPPVDLWPNVVRRAAMQPDVESLLLMELERIAQTEPGIDRMQ